MDSHNREPFKKTQITNKLVLDNIDQTFERDTNYTDNVCRFCNEEFLLSTELDEHIRDYHKSEKFPYECLKCDRLFTSLKGLEFHLKFHNRKYFNCPFCKHKFTSEAFLEKHKKKEHVIVDLECPTCFKKFTKKKLFDYHLKSHEADKPFKCRYCPKQFLQCHHLSDHERIHTKEKPFLCTYCGLSFSLALSLNSHLAAKHEIHKNGTFNCKECEKKFPSAPKLEMHIKNNHSSERPYSCRYCDSKFAVEFYRKLHEKRHTNKKHFTCTICHTTMSTSYTLKTHMYNKHNVVRSVSDELKREKYSCHLCDKAFPLASSLNTHMKVHSELRNCVCNECGEKFRLEKHLQVHMNVMHLDNKPHACNVSLSKNHIFIANNTNTKHML